MRRDEVKVQEKALADLSSHRLSREDQDQQCMAVTPDLKLVETAATLGAAKRRSEAV